MGRTKLFQAPGSPLIQGQSRTQRPFVSDWFSGYLAAVATAVVGLTAWGLWSGNIMQLGVLDAIAQIANFSLMLFGPGAFVGAGIGVFAGRKFGAGHPWRVGWFVATICGIGSVYVVLNVLVLFGSPNA